MEKHQRIIVDIGNDGDVQIQTKGFSGPVCLAESEFLKEILGEEISKQLTPAYYQQDERINETKRKFIPLCG